MFLRVGSVDANSGLQRALDACRIYDFTREVEAVSERCLERPVWTGRQEAMQTMCVLKFTLATDGRVTDSAAEPTGCDARLAP
jgi:hypothetical protein